MMPKTLDEEEDSDGLSLSSQSNDLNSRSATSKTSNTDKSGNASSEVQTELAKQETKLVKRSKALVLLVLLAAAAGCGTGKLRLGWTEKKSLRSSSNLPLRFFL
jgi:polyphosphate kinase 2 (PPK2 family)